MLSDQQPREENTREHREKLQAALLSVGINEEEIAEVREAVVHIEPADAHHE